jgi:hypothetical protein
MWRAGPALLLATGITALISTQAPAGNVRSILVLIGKSPSAVRVIEEILNPELAQKAPWLLGRPVPRTIAVETLRKLGDADRGALILERESLGLTKSVLSHSSLDTPRYSIEGWKLKFNEPFEFNLPGQGNFKLREIDLGRDAW